MNDKVLTAPVVELIDAHIRQPPVGSSVLVLQHGGVLTMTTWTSTSLKDFDAWCPYPKIPVTVKERQLARFK